MYKCTYLQLYSQKVYTFINKSSDSRVRLKPWQPDRRKRHRQ